MSTIDAAPFLFLATFTCDGDVYTAAVTTAQFQPTQPTSSIVTIDGNTTNFAGKSAWQFHLAGVQDWETADSLSLFMLDHDGQDVLVSVEFPSGAIAAGTVTIAAPEIGGDALTPATFDKTFPSTKPLYTPAP